MIEIFFNLIPTVLIFLFLWMSFSFLARKFGILKNRLKLRMLIISISAFLFYALFIFFLISTMFRPETKDFKSTEWVISEQNRYKMVDNLIDENLLIGLNKREVEKTLGEPSKKIDHNFWVYEIVGQTTFDFEFIDLVIRFENNKVFKVEKIKKS